MNWPARISAAFATPCAVTASSCTALVCVLLARGLSVEKWLEIVEAGAEQIAPHPMRGLIRLPRTSSLGEKVVELFHAPGAHFCVGASQAAPSALVRAFKPSPEHAILRAAMSASPPSFQAASARLNAAICVQRGSYLKAERGSSLKNRGAGVCGRTGPLQPGESPTRIGSANTRKCPDPMHGSRRCGSRVPIAASHRTTARGRRPAAR